MFIIQNHYAKLGKLGVWERTPKVCTNLSCGRFVFVENGVGIEALAKPIFVRGVSPFNGRRTLRPNLSRGRFVFVENGEGIEVLA